jgi:hypothetical protein
MSKRMKVASSIVVAALAVVAGAKDAHALGPIGVEVGAKGGVATNPADSGATNPLGFGLGARGGVNITSIYLGASLMYYLGGSQTLAGVDASVHTLLYGLEAGYNIDLEILTIRPQLGVGNASLVYSGSIPVPGGGTISGDHTDSHLYLEPSVAAIIGLGGLFVGADAGVLLIPSVDQGGGNSKTYTSFTLHGQVGLKF